MNDSIRAKIEAASNKHMIEVDRAYNSIQQANMPTILCDAAFVAGAHHGWNLAVSELVGPLREALKFYGHDAIAMSADKDGTLAQYWTDQGIWDHGMKARNALRDLSAKLGVEDEK